MDTAATTTERPGRRLAVDAALGALVVAMIGGAISADLGGGEPGVLAYALATGLGALMLLRRKFPVATLMLCAGGLLAYYTLDQPYIGLAVPMAAALYSAAERGHPGWASGTAAGLIVVSNGFRIQEGDDIAFLLGYQLAINVVLMAAVIAFGDGVRSRRRWRSELERRARAAVSEHEREIARQVEQERLRIARDLHDVLAHAISVISLHSDVAREALGDDPADVPAARDAVAAVRVAGADALRELRATLRLLRDPDQEDGPRQPMASISRLDRLVDAASEGGVQVHVEISGTPVPLPVAVDGVAHQIVQESITNVVRHAHATTATVRLSYSATELGVRVVDDGRADIDGDEPGTGWGIIGMRERATLLGGRLTAGAAPVGGFVVDALLPLNGRS